MSDSLYTDSVGAFYIDISLGGGAGTRLVCSSVDLTMSVNAMHTATVTLSNGEGISEDFLNDPFNVLLTIQKRTQDSTSAYLPGCAIYEQASSMHSSDQMVFKGYIVSAALSYKTGTTSSCDVTLECAGPAALLNIAPVALYFDASLSNIINKKTSQEYITEGVAVASGLCYTEAAKELFEHCQTLNTGATIPEILACCVNTVKVANTYADDKTEMDAEKRDPAVLQALGGGTRFNPQLMHTSVAEDWIGSILKRMQECASTNTIWNTLVRLLSTSDYALQMLPRWSCDTPYDFKMAVKPVDTWAAKHYITLNENDITAVNVSCSCDETINTPDLIFVSFDEHLSYSGGNNEECATGIVGIAGKNPGLVAMLQDEVASDPLEALATVRDVSKPYKVKDVKAPSWLGAYITNLELNEDTNEDKKDPLLSTPAPRKASAEKTEGDVEAYPGTSRTNSPDAQKAANNVAQAIFNHDYKSQDVCSIDLLPSMRFGFKNICLENCIGDTLELTIGSSALNQTNVNRTRLRGTLQGLRFSYSSSSRSDIGYKALINRVRVLNDSTPDPQLSCPLYLY